MCYLSACLCIASEVLYTCICLPLHCFRGALCMIYLLLQCFRGIYTLFCLPWHCFRHVLHIISLLAFTLFWLCRFSCFSLLSSTRDWPHSFHLCLELAPPPPSPPPLHPPSPPGVGVIWGTFLWCILFICALGLLPTHFTPLTLPPSDLGLLGIFPWCMHPSPIPIRQPHHHQPSPLKISTEESS